MAPKVKAPAGTKAKAKAADKEATKKAKVVKAATKGKQFLNIYVCSALNFGRFLIPDRVFNV
jgi:hypothetical protein